MKKIFGKIKLSFYFSTKVKIGIEEIGCMIVHYFIKHKHFKGFNVENLGTNHEPNLTFLPSKFHEANFEAGVTINAKDDISKNDIITGIVTGIRLFKLGNKNVKFKGILEKGHEIVNY